MHATTAATTTTAATQCSHTPPSATAIFLCARVCHYGSNNSRNKVRPYATTGNSFVYASFNDINKIAVQPDASSVSCVCASNLPASKNHDNDKTNSAATHHQQRHTWCARVPATTTIATQRRAARPAATHLLCTCASNNNNSNTAPRSATSSNTPGLETPGPSFLDRILVRSVFCPRIWSGGRALGTLSHPGNEILVGSVSHSWVHHLTSPERDDSVPKSEPRGPEVG
ncbi:hypothetical protein ACLKA6_012338 [Drosophila palustris]